MYQGNWTCSTCEADIKELPFEPRSAEGLKCRDCHFKSKDAGASGSAPATKRKMHQGEWPCSGCGNTITELPFEPRDTNNLKCRDCFIKSKNS